MATTNEDPITSQPRVKEGMTPNPFSQPHGAGAANANAEKGGWHGPWQLCESTWACGGFEWQVIWGFCGGRARDGEDGYGMIDVNAPIVYRIIIT
ncbi:uncharacterized protein I303_105072 [Kwoniella dejecticola CBS 10117]|uniref:Uncharacterized protein n=1 Tax=Kwoniella dejecticola CBS 10117 TaxID=1296121 RepID=A0A1A6A3J2_9TREE|nr:uncharacterized protein I303_05482 [Kwoniella dejecticola CBS 10117]OBR84623.1 hypothetical protein I303_05482 [Kwoniella dejecticola CBS 10117]